MKKIFFVACSLCSFLTSGQIINFPDNNLKTRLLQSSPDYPIAATGWSNGVAEQYIKIDSNNDGEIEQSEALAVTFLNISGSGISNLSGMEYFTNLHWFSFGNNQVTSATNLSGLINMEKFGCFGNQLTEINVSTYSMLINLTCSNNQLTSLDLSGLSNLKLLYCDNNFLTSLDLSGNPVFNDLSCRNNHLTSINIKNGAMQLFGPQTVYNECWDGNPNLSMICADDFEVSALQSFLTSCGTTQSITVSSSCQMGIDEHKNSLLAIHPNPSSSFVSFDFEDKNTRLSGVRVYNTSGVLVSDFLPLSDGRTINVAYLPKGLYLLLATILDSNDTHVIKLFKE